MFEYNDDNGLCDYTDRYCDRMGLGARVEKNYYGLGDTSYYDCVESDTQEDLENLKYQ